MAVLHFVLNEDAVTILHDALACMFKFSDHVCLEGRKDKLTLTTLNISKSAYICFAFSGNRFFSRYHFDANTQHRDRFSCQLYTRVRNHQQPWPPANIPTYAKSSPSFRSSGLVRAERRPRHASRRLTGARLQLKMALAKRAASSLGSSAEMA